MTSSTIVVMTIGFDESVEATDNHPSSVPVVSSYESLISPVPVFAAN